MARHSYFRVVKRADSPGKDYKIMERTPRAQPRRPVVGQPDQGEHVGGYP